MKTILLLLFTPIVFFANAQPGTIDTSFGIGGKVTIIVDKNASLDIGKAVLQTDDKIIEVGDYASFKLIAVRITANGILDSSYGVNGKALIQFPFTEQIYFNDAAIQKDNKILMAGYGDSNYFDPVYSGVITRLNTNGSVDSSFGTNGVVRITQNGYGSYGPIAVQADNKIVAFGGTNNSAFITRLLENGAVDMSFGVNGYVYTPDKYGFFACKIQADGKIVIAGGDYSYSSVERKFCLQRYMPDGTIDQSFGNNGTTITSFNDDAIIHDFAFQSDGKIVVTGETTVFSEEFPTYFATARYTKDGILDSSFGINGKVATTFPSGFAIAHSIIVQKDNKIVIGGQQGRPEPDFTIQRLTASGVPDSTFGENSIAITDFGFFSSVASVLQQSSGKIIAAGLSGGSGFSYSAARYLNDDAGQQQTPIARIKRWLHRHGITWDDCPPSICNNLKGYAVQRSGDGAHWSTVYKTKGNTNIHSSINNSQFTINNYYEDPSPLSGANYYRLQTTSTDGAVAYSNMIMINSNEDAVRIYPNPAKNILHIEGLSLNSKNLPAGRQVKITVADFMGNIAISQQLIANSPSSYSLNVASLKPGNYLMKIETGGEVVVRKFIKE